MCEVFLKLKTPEQRLPFPANFPLTYFLKTSENIWFFTRSGGVEVEY